MPFVLAYSGGSAGEWLGLSGTPLPYQALSGTVIRYSVVKNTLLGYHRLTLRVKQDWRKHKYIIEGRNFRQNIVQFLFVVCRFYWIDLSRTFLAR
jgi:hypothetical protein